MFPPISPYPPNGQKINCSLVIIIPYKLFINEKGLAKLEIYTALGKKLFDKRSVIKDRDNKRSLERIKKNN